MTNHVVCLSVVLFSSSTLCHASAYIVSIVSDLCVHGETLYIYLLGYDCGTIAVRLHWGTICYCWSWKQDRRKSTWLCCWVLIFLGLDFIYCSHHDMKICLCNCQNKPVMNSACTETTKRRFDLIVHFFLHGKNFERVSITKRWWTEDVLTAWWEKNLTVKRSIKWHYLMPGMQHMTNSHQTHVRTQGIDTDRYTRQFFPHCPVWENIRCDENLRPNTEMMGFCFCITYFS